MSDWKSCWLCGQEIAAGTAQPRAAVEAPATTATSAAASSIAVEPRGESAAMKWIGRGALGVVSFIVVCMMVGIAADQGIEAAFWYSILLAPAFVITATKAANRRNSASAMSAFQIATSFVKYAIFTWLALLGIAVSILAALFIVCISGGGPNFQ